MSLFRNSNRGNRLWLIAKPIRQAYLKRVEELPSQRLLDKVVLYEWAMLRELDANQYKGDYTKLTTNELLYELQLHVDKLRIASHGYGPPTVDRQNRILEFAADIGNLCFMVADKQKVLTDDVVTRRKKEQDYVRFEPF